MLVRRSSRSPGAFIVVVGPDGVGKTSVASALLDRWHGSTSYFHFRPPLRGPLDARPAPGPPPGEKWPEAEGSTVGGWVRLLRNVVRFWLGYLGSVRPAIRRGDLVIADRYIYGYQVQPRALRFHGPKVMADIAVRLVPQPDLIVNLTAPPAVIHARKAELTLAEIEAELTGWAGIAGGDAVAFEAIDTPDEIAARILDTLMGAQSGAAT